MEISDDNVVRDSLARAVCLALARVVWPVCELVHHVFALLVQYVVSLSSYNIPYAVQFANYVVQRMLDLASDTHREELVKQIKPHIGALR